MKICKKSTLLSIALGLLFFAPGLALANKASVSIEVPKSVAKEEEIVIVLKVKHSENTPSHYVNWVNLKINNKDMKKWEFTPDNRPDTHDFIIKFKFMVNMDTKVSAEANCILHGSAGPASAFIKTKQ